MEADIALLRQTMGNLYERNRRTMENTGARLRQAVDNVNELNGRRQAFANAQQQIMVQFQEQANGEGDAVEMVRWICNHFDDGFRLVSHSWLFLHNAV
jgi:hypothetical protein